MNVTIARDLQGKPKGFAHVEFSNELEAQNALSLSGELNSLIHSHVKARGEIVKQSLQPPHSQTAG